MIPNKVYLKGSPFAVVGASPPIGSLSPDLIGIDPDLKERSLSEFRGKKKILCFVPSLDTPVCSASAHQFGKQIKTRKDVALIYCSMDLPFALQRICLQEKEIIFLSLFRYPEVAEHFGARMKEGPLAGLCARAVFVLDSQNRIIYHQLVSEITEEPDYAKAFHRLDSPD